MSNADSPLLARVYSFIEAAKKVRRQAETFAKVSDNHFVAVGGLLQAIERGVSSGEPIEIEPFLTAIGDASRPAIEIRLLQKACIEFDDALKACEGAPR